jgi:hypothetical protein
MGTVYLPGTRRTRTRGPLQPPAQREQVAEPRTASSCAPLLIQPSRSCCNRPQPRNPFNPFARSVVAPAAVPRVTLPIRARTATLRLRAVVGAPTGRAALRGARLRALMLCSVAGASHRHRRTGRARAQVQRTGGSNSPDTQPAPPPTAFRLRQACHPFVSRSTSPRVCTNEREIREIK